MKAYILTAAVAASSIVHAQQSLNEAIELAKAHRPALESARSRLAQAQWSRRALGAGSPTRLLVGYTSNPETGGTDDDLVVAHPLDVFGRSAAGRSAGNALISQAEAEVRKIELEVQNEVVGAYIATTASLELAQTAASLQETLQRLFDVTKQRVVGGAIAGVQLTRVGIELDQARLKTEHRKSEYTANLGRLRALTATASLTVATTLPDFAPETIDIADLPQLRPDLLLLTAEVELAEADARMAKTSRLPELEIQARRTPWQDEAGRFGVRLQLTVPLLDNGRARSETRSASARAEVARKALADLTLVAEGEVTSSQTEMHAAALQVDQYQALVGTARQLVERLRPALTEQATTLIEVLDATRALRDVEEAYVEAKHRLAEARARYLRATGQVFGGRGQ